MALPFPQERGCVYPTCVRGARVGGLPKIAGPRAHGAPQLRGPRTSHAEARFSVLRVSQSSEHGRSGGRDSARRRIAQPSADLTRQGTSAMRPTPTRSRSDSCSSRTAAHGVHANYYLHNRGKVGLLLCQAMELSFRVSSRYGTESFPLIAASGEGTHADFTLLDPPYPAPALVGSTVASRSVSLPADALGRLRDMQEQIPKMMAEAEIVGRVVGSTLVWDGAAASYSYARIDISSAPEPWRHLARLLTGDGSATGGDGHVVPSGPGACRDDQPLQFPPPDRRGRRRCRR